MTKPPPANEADLTDEELAAAAIAMESALDAEPLLNNSGFGAGNADRAERGARIQQGREAIRQTRSLAQFTAARRWLRQFPKTKALTRRGTSYGLKHLAELDIGYVSNGVFIAAAIAEGFRVQRLDYASLNAWLNISRTAWRTGHAHENRSRISSVLNLEADTS